MPRILTISALFLLLAPVSSAYWLDFTDLPEGAPVLDTYLNLYGVLFSPGWERIDVEYNAVLITALPAWINFYPAAPLVSFYVDARYRMMQPFDIEVWSGPSATGVLLETHHVVPMQTFEPLCWSMETFEPMCGSLESGIGSVAFPGGEGLMIRRLTNEGPVLPEPGSMTLIALGFAALGAGHWRRRHHS